MRKALTIFILACVSYHVADAQEKAHTRITYGVEWGWSAVFFSGYHYNFFAPEGYRVNPSGHSFDLCGNAEAYLHVGYDITGLWNISFYAGLAGVGKYDMVVPLSVRGTRFFGDDPNTDRWFVYLDCGTGVVIKPDPQEILAGKVGAGYRLSLSRNIKLDFMANLRTTFTHPRVEYYGKEIPFDRINRNNAYVSALSFDIALTF